MVRDNPAGFIRARTASASYSGESYLNCMSVKLELISDLVLDMIPVHTKLL